MSAIFKDILTETKQGRTKYSQGRIYLFVSFSAFFLLNVILAFCAITNYPMEDKDTLLVISENLRWALGTFGLYVLGGKGIGAFRDRQTGISNDYGHEAQYPGYYNNHGGHYPPYGGHPPHGGGQKPTSDDVDTYHDDYSEGSSEGEYYAQGDEEVD
ncbi:MAG: hypothetical protein P8J32_05935 [bacterium]|nr:hypothetical protein [bacterium]